MTQAHKMRVSGDDSRAGTGRSRSCLPRMRLRRPRRPGNGQTIETDRARRRTLYLRAGLAARRAGHHLRSRQPDQRCSPPQPPSCGFTTVDNLRSTLLSRVAAGVCGRRCIRHSKVARHAAHAAGSLFRSARLCTSFRVGKRSPCDDDACLRQPLTADPGTRAEYSDIGFMILGYLVEKIAGERLDSFCQREIFAPLGMSTTRFCSGEDTARCRSRLRRMIATSGIASSRAKCKMKTLP